MVDNRLLPAIRETIRQNEIGDATPYCLSFAEKDKSGASFGFMQGDTNVSALARTTLSQVLTAATVPAAQAARILAALSRPLPNGNPLSANDTRTSNQALASPKGQTLVDAMDQQLLTGVLHGLDSCIAVAKARAMTLAPIANLYIAPWVNMSGPPTLLNSWIGGAPIFGLPPPVPPQVTQDNMRAYLQATAYFHNNPRNFAHLEACIAKGAVLLPKTESDLIA